MNITSFLRGTAVLMLFLGKQAVAHDLNDYLREFRSKNPAYLAALQRWRSEEEKIRAVSSLPDPMLSVGVFAEEVETRVGPQKQRLSISQAIPWKGKLALGGQRAKEMAGKAKAELDAVALELETELKMLFAELYYIGKSIAITNDHLKLLKDLEAVITQRYETNAAPYHDLIRIQIEIDALANRLATLELSGAPVIAGMNAILGRTHDSAVAFPANLPRYVYPHELDAARLLSNLEENHPAMRGLRHQIAADRTSLDLAKKNFFPDFRLGLDWINTGDALNPNLPDSGKDPIMFTVGVNLPIWKRKYRAIERASAFRVEASIKSREDVRTKLETKLARALFQLDDANRKLDLYRDHIIPKAEESLTVIMSGFQTGDNNYLDLIEAEKGLLAFLLSANQAEANQLKAVAAIEAVLGKAPFPLAEE